MKPDAAFPGQVAKKIRRFVSLGIGQERYGIEVTKTREIIARYDMVPLPKTPEFIEGLISLRGEIIPVVDLRKRFELPHKERDADTRIILIEMKDVKVGIQVDRIYEVLKLPEDAVEPPPPLVSGLKSDYLEGVVEVKGKLTTILNLDEIFSSTERIILNRVEEIGKEGLGPGDNGSGTEKLRIPEVEMPESRPSSVVTHPSATTANVMDDGMALYSGKSYYIGKRHKGAVVELREAGGKLTACINGERIKELEV